MAKLGWAPSGTSHTAASTHAGSTTAPGRGVELVDDLLDRDDRPAGRQHGLLLHADDAPDLHVAVAVGPLGVDDRDVRAHRRHRGELLAGERAGDRGESSPCARRGRCRRSRAARRTAGPTRRRRSARPGRRGCARRAAAVAASRARRRRGTGAATRRPGCRPTRTSAPARSRRRSAGRRRRPASSARGAGRGGPGGSARGRRRGG